jgi:hypothetical protein
MGRSNSLKTVFDIVEMFYNFIFIVFLILFIIGFLYVVYKVSTGEFIVVGPSPEYGGDPVNAPGQ